MRKVYFIAGELPLTILVQFIHSESLLLVLFFELLIVLKHPTYDQTKQGGSLKSVQLLAGAVPDNGSILEPICLGVPVGLLHLLLLGQEAGQKHDDGGGVVEQQVEHAQVAADGGGEEEVEDRRLHPVHIHHRLRSVVEHVLGLPSVRSRHHLGYFMSVSGKSSSQGLDHL